MTKKKAGKDKLALGKPVLRNVRRALADGGGPSTELTVRDELLIYWDADSPLTLAELARACDDGLKLGDTGIPAQRAEWHTIKYNSIINRAGGRGPFVSTNEAVSFLKRKMIDIIGIITGRAQP